MTRRVKTNESAPFAIKRAAGLSAQDRLLQATGCSAAEVADSIRFAKQPGDVARVAKILGEETELSVQEIAFDLDMETASAEVLSWLDELSAPGEEAAASE
ncbi:hypothetical protein K4H03_20955 [Mycobacterium tuberculosis]|nr:hypothetical protein [Mycobacterium tuberculosis]